MGVVGDCTPTLAMVAVQLGFAGLNIFSKLALDYGMSAYVMITYRQIVASVVLTPIAYFLERKTRVKITRAILFQIFFSSLFGLTINQLTYILSLKYISPTIACALNNMLPAITFIMAVPFRMETVGIRTLAGQAKIIGTVVCVGGSMLMTFYKGSLVHIWPSPIHWKYFEDMTASESMNATGHSTTNMLFGAVLIIASCFGYSVWFIIQARMSKTFSSPYTSSAIMCWMSAVQCFIFGAAIERKASAWEIGWDIRLYTVLYIGLFGSAFAVSLMAWCIEKRGPLFVSMFNPLLLIIVAVLGWAILDEKLYFGTVIGSALIVVGLYMVLWGKGRELEKMMNIEDKGSIGLPVYISPTHEAHGAQK